MHEHIGPSVDSTSPGQRGFASEILSRHGGGVRVENGIKYARGEGEQSVRVRACQVPGEVELVVADTGTGIAEDAVPSLFEPFHRGRTDGNGYGLGLATVKRLVEAHGGQISFETRRDVGTTFLVRLPAAAGEGHETENPAPTGSC